LRIIRVDSATASYTPDWQLAAQNGRFSAKQHYLLPGSFLSPGKIPRRRLPGRGLPRSRPGPAPVLPRSRLSRLSLLPPHVIDDRLPKPAPRLA